MDDKKFKEMDQSLMKSTQSLREQKISEGLLKGFSASVERRLSGPLLRSPKASFEGRGLVWVPTLAVMVLASVAVLRSPVQEIEIAQAVVSAEEVQEDLDVLSELGVLDEYEDADLLGGENALLDENMELTQKIKSISALA